MESNLPTWHVSAGNCKVTPGGAVDQRQGNRQGSRNIFLSLWRPRVEDVAGQVRGVLTPIECREYCHLHTVYHEKPSILNLLRLLEP